jgi:hypothetical protein
MKIKILTACLLTTFALFGTGCMKRSLVTFEDHPKQAFTAVELIEEHNYLIMSTIEHRFVMCKDTGNQLTCARSCGGDKEIECPKGALTSLSRGSNVR